MDIIQAVALVSIVALSYFCGNLVGYCQGMKKAEELFRKYRV